MGSKISPILSNIFLSILEAKFIDENINNGIILAYKRFVDDIFLVIKNTEKNNFFRKINNLHKGLKFTINEPINENLVFLDTCIFLKNNQYEIKNYRKPTASNVVTNFRKSETPIKYKISTLVGSIYRANDTCSNPEDLNLTLKNLEKRFVSNGYPQGMISERIELIKKNNFVPKKVIDWNAEIKDNPNRNFSISIPFTSNRCQKIEKKIRKIIKSITPNFNINFCWRNIKLSQLITPKTKPATPKLECAGTVYKFKCFCKICYMGESQRPLIKRIAEHSQRSSKSAITKHIYSCPAYLDALKRKFGEIPTRNTKYF